MPKSRHYLQIHLTITYPANTENFEELGNVYANELSKIYIRDTGMQKFNTLHYIGGWDSFDHYYISQDDTKENGILYGGFLCTERTINMSRFYKSLLSYLYTNFDNTKTEVVFEFGDRVQPDCNDLEQIEDYDIEKYFRKTRYKFYGPQNVKLHKIVTNFIRKQDVKFSVILGYNKAYVNNCRIAQFDEDERKYYTDKLLNTCLICDLIPRDGDHVIKRLIDDFVVELDMQKHINFLHKSIIRIIY